MENKNKENTISKKLITAALSIAIALFIISGAISIPLFFRSFYYAQVDALDIPASSGYTENEIREAFDEMMDYCMGKSDTFGTGNLAWSEEGKMHFDDCKNLFTLDKIILIVSAAFILFLVLILIKTCEDKGEVWRRFLRAGLFSGAGMLFLGGILGIIGAIDFGAFFVKFHHTFFPGKDNWLFNPTKDEIIKILPEEFFRNCAIMIVSVIVLLSVLLIITGLRKWKSAK